MKWERIFLPTTNCTILDVAKGEDRRQLPDGSPTRLFIPPAIPIHPDTRNTLYEYGREVTIGDNVWIGGNSVICPGVHVGSNVVIGAGSVRDQRYSGLECGGRQSLAG